MSDERCGCCRFMEHWAYSEMWCTCGHERSRHDEEGLCQVGWTQGTVEIEVL
jgi:hypothetical protein